MDELKHQVMINQFVLIAGCASDQAQQLLRAAHWHFETALSAFFQEANIPYSHQMPSEVILVDDLAQCLMYIFCKEGGDVHACQHPGDSPNFPDALAMFSRLRASDSVNGCSPAVPMAPVSGPPAPYVNWAVDTAPQGVWAAAPLPPHTAAPDWPATLSQQASSEQPGLAVEAER